MKALKTPKSKHSTPTVALEGPPLMYQFTDKPGGEPIHSDSKHAKKSGNGVVAKTPAKLQERRDLKDLEIWLNNCVNLAERLEGKQAAKLAQLLRHARKLAIRLRG